MVGAGRGEQTQEGTGAQLTFDKCLPSFAVKYDQMLNILILFWAWVLMISPLTVLPHDYTVLIYLMGELQNAD